ncbi:MAG: 16S rRNA (cytidine(1402)-2'-O)-methyltransferase [Gammaproteobacteria bacterium]|nr:16S rRNA (cytidine(1402)-2'-O)-methyltransferase [Gammaproteobacteria bacterium]
MGTLYIVATPIGHLRDITLRALEILKSVDLIAAEDTRHSKRLLDFYGIHTPCIAYHEHNEVRQAKALLKDLKLEGKNIALISDAGTPLMSDPGYILVREAKQLNMRVVPIPGPCAAIAALCASGVSTHKFVFEGFLSPRAHQRQKELRALTLEPRTLVFYESCHRILNSLKDMVTIFGAHRQAALIRELTKIHETIVLDTLEKLLEKTEHEEEAQKGEFVVVVEGCHSRQTKAEEGKRIVRILLEQVSLKDAVMLASQITGVKKNHLYSYALHCQSEQLFVDGP